MCVFLSLYATAATCSTPTSNDPMAHCADFTTPAHRVSEKSCHRHKYSEKLLTASYRAGSACNFRETSSTLSWLFHNGFKSTTGPRILSGTPNTRQSVSTSAPPGSRVKRTCSQARMSMSSKNVKDEFRRDLMPMWMSSNVVADAVDGNMPQWIAELATCKVHHQLRTMSFSLPKGSPPKSL